MVSCRCEEILTLTLSISHVCSPMFIQNSHFPNIFIYCNIIVFLYFIKFPFAQPKWINKLIKTFSSLITPFHFSNHFSNLISHLINSWEYSPRNNPFHFSKVFKIISICFREIFHSISHFTFRKGSKNEVPCLINK